MISLTIMGKLPPTDATFATIGQISAYVFIALWLSLPFVSKMEKVIGGKK